MKWKKICVCCNLSAKDKNWQFYENEYWIVFLADKQDYIGRCLVMSKRHIENMSQINMEEWLSLKDIITSLEELLKTEFGADLINCSCLMNNAYKEKTPHPHMHFHIRPRYRKAVNISGYEYVDNEFAHHYNNNADEICNEMRQIVQGNKIG